MAASYFNLQTSCRRLAAASSLGNRILNSSSSSSSSLSPSFYCLLRRRAVHVSAYDKNPEEEEHDVPTVVPDHVIQPQPREDYYWAPHPQTGVFGPSSSTEDHESKLGVFHTQEDSVLGQKAFFRHLEDLEKPPHHP